MSRYAARRMQTKNVAFSFVVALIASLLIWSPNWQTQVAQAAAVGSGVCESAVASSSGVSVSQVESDCVVKFTNTGSNTWTVPSYVTSVDFLVVGGGGGGGHEEGGGGGAGE